MQEQLNARIDTLSLDHRRGAAEIVQDAAGLLADIAREAAESEISAEHLFERAIRRLARGQPTMAPVLNLLNRACLARETAGDDWRQLAEAFEGLAQRRADLFEGMKGCLPKLRPFDSLIVFSNSSTVARLTIEAFSRLGWPRKVFCGEGRPIGEGIVMAQKLTAAGLDVTLFTDAALMSRVPDVDGVWVGGDSLSKEGLVNKVGSRALAILAQAGGGRFVSMIGSDKFLSSGMLPYFGFLPQNPREIGAGEADSINVHNEYYETVPLELIDSILTEDGIFSPRELVASIAEESVSDLFRRILHP